MSDNFFFQSQLWTALLSGREMYLNAKSKGTSKPSKPYTSSRPPHSETKSFYQLQLYTYGKDDGAFIRLHIDVIPKASHEEVARLMEYLMDPVARSKKASQ